MEPLVWYMSEAGFKIIMYICITGLGATVLFLISMLINEMIRKKLW